MAQAVGSRTTYGVPIVRLQQREEQPIDWFARRPALSAEASELPIHAAVCSRAADWAPPGC
jgi:hypothetical protein